MNIDANEIETALLHVARQSQRIADSLEELLKLIKFERDQEREYNDAEV